MPYMNVREDRVKQDSLIIWSVAPGLLQISISRYQKNIVEENSDITLRAGERLDSSARRDANLPDLAANHSFKEEAPQPPIITFPER